MKKLVIVHVWILALLILAPLMAQAGSSSSEEIGQVGALAGKVFVVREGERFALTEGAKLHAGDRIETDAAGTVKIIQKDGSILYVGTSSSLILMSHVRLSLMDGSVRVQTTGAFAVLMPDAQTIRSKATGTDFFVRTDKMNSEVMSTAETVAYRGRMVTPGVMAVAKDDGSVHMKLVSEEESSMLLVGTGMNKIKDVAPLGYSKPDKKSGEKPLPDKSLLP